MDSNELEKWDSLVERWIKFMPPIRPDAADLKAIKRVIISRQFTPANALVLGATPELRDLTSSFNIATTTVDQNPRMITAMKVLQWQRAAREECVVADWFDFLPRAGNRFELILSDLTQGNIPYTRRAEFYQSVSHALKPGGLFVDRIFKYEEASRLYSLRSIAINYSKRLCFDLGVLNEILFKILASQTVMNAGEAQLGQLYEELTEHCKSSLALYRQIELLDELIAPSSVTWYCGRPWPEIRSDYPGELSLEWEYRRTDRYRRGLPTLQVWRKAT